MQKLGVIEGFFGPQWSEQDRLTYAIFLSRFGGDFYIYAPKQDAFLRKAWRDSWPESYVEKLQSLIKAFHCEGVKFGVGFSPFGLGETLTEEDITHLSKKLNVLNDLKIDMLGLFFDDMPITANLAATQIEVLNFVRENFKGQIIFCPSFYTYDPILDKVFGQRPSHYLEDIAEGVALEVSIAWTGPKVISPVIDEDHLKEVTMLLKRKPFIWENFYANDGPRNCKFLKLKPFTGRDQYFLKSVDSLGLNLMNQPELSKILFLSSKYALTILDSESAYRQALSDLCSVEFKNFMLEKGQLFLEKGLDFISPEDRAIYISELNLFSDRAALEVIAWLEDKYIVGSECLTD